MAEIWEERRPSRVKVLQTHANRIVRWRRNNAPFLSGDLFSDMSDTSVYPPRYRGKQPGIEEIRRARVIFCPSDKLDRFFDEFESEITAKVILCGNSDFEFKDMPLKIPKSVRQLFLQNSFLSEHPLVTTLPIGIENFRWGVNGNPKNLSPGESWIGRRNEVLIGPFGLTHPIRLEVRNEFVQPAEGIRFISGRMEPAEYAKIAMESRYVAAVRGNGVDTHRHWETLYRGSIPLILEDGWVSGIENLELPFIKVQGWTVDQMRSVLMKERSFTFEPEKCPALWWPYWKNLIASYL
jgi:hypothetical protein